MDCKSNVDKAICPSIEVRGMALQVRGDYAGFPAASTQLLHLEQRDRETSEEGDDIQKRLEGHSSLRLPTGSKRGA